MKRNHSRILQWLLFLSVLLIAVVCSACGDSQAELQEPLPESQTAETENLPVEEVPAAVPEGKTVKLETRHMTLTCPEAYMDVLRHQEVVSEAVAVEIFSTEISGAEAELFRIYFGDIEMGVLAGYLTVDNAEIPVTYAINQYNDDEFADEEARALYFDAMNSFNEIMNGIQADPRFHREKTVEPVESVDVELPFGAFSLPETMEYEELEENGQYQVRFYGNVAGERIALYSIFLGEPGAEAVLGTYTADGEAQQLSVESYELLPAENWSEEDISSAYSMMATINNVLQDIMSSENYAEAIPE